MRSLSWLGSISLSLALASAAAAHSTTELERFPNARAARLVVLLSLLNATQPAVAAPEPRGSLSDLDRKNGFRDVRFGDTIGSLGQRVPAASDGGLRVYSRPSDSKRIGAAELDRIGYGFIRARLSRIIIYAKAGAANADALLRAVEHRYGPGASVAGGDRSRIWNGRRVEMTFSTDTGRAQLVIRSKSLRTT